MTEKKCTKCELRKPLTDFAKNRKNPDGLYYVCKPCHNARQRQYVEADREKYRAQKRAAMRKLVDTVIDGYGAKCSCCGETRREFLTLDHVGGGGAEQRRNSYAHVAHRDAIKRNFPPDYRVLCFNCNCSIGFHGYCPHKKVGKQLDTNRRLVYI